MKKIKFALVGCGRISRKHIESINELKNAELIAVCDIDYKKAELVSKQFPLVNSYDNYNSMLENETIDVVSILTPSGLHPKHTIDIVKKYKKHIVCEKPMALKLEDADEMIRVCDENRVRLFVVKQNRFNIPVIKLREAIDSGKFGKIVMGTVRVRWSRNQQYYDRDPWRGTWEFDGGVISNQASHHVDLLEWMLGEPVSVFAKTDTFLSDIEVDDTALAILKFKNGALGIIEATTATRPTDLEGSISVLGENGTVVISGFAVNEMQTWNFSNETPDEQQKILANYRENPPDVYGFGHIRYLENVIDCIINDKSALVDGLEGRKSLELINAIYESAETGKEIFMKFTPRKSKLGFKNGSK